jgi:hypothetical protein
MHNATKRHEFIRLWGNLDKQKKKKNEEITNLSRNREIPY